MKCVSIGAPYKYSDYDNVSFPLYFDGAITDVNYKHVACSADVLKTMSHWDNPNMSPAVADYLKEIGVIDSMNDCIEINGKKVREWQKSSQLACMIMVGELGDNAKMNIDFNGAIDAVRIEDLNQPFVITLYSGLIFPNGTRLKQTQTFTYDVKQRIFSEKAGTDRPNNADFSAFYNGIELKNDYNIVDVESSTFSLDNLLVIPQNSDATVQIEPQFKEIGEGYHYVYVTVTAPDGYTQKTMQFILNRTYKQPTARKVQIARAVKITVGSGLAVLCIVMGVALILKRRRCK
ncbi:MAG: hypothetical protein MJ132_06525 [Clostridia bacterium]|nr:hypothetical protein [Clostridia bacterium]